MSLATKFGPAIISLWTKFISPWLADVDVKAIASNLGMNKVQGIMFSVMLMAVLFFGYRTTTLSAENAVLMVQTQNAVAMADSVRYYENKVDELEGVKLALVTTNQDLDQYNIELAEELEKERGNVKTIIKNVVSVVRDTVLLENIVSVDSVSAETSYASVSFKDATQYESSSRFLEGTTFVEIMDGLISNSTTSITRDEINLAIVSGFRQNDNNQYEIFARTDYPGVTFDMDGAVLDIPEPTRQKKWGIGLGVGYDFINKGPQIGVGLQRNLIRF